MRCQRMGVISCIEMTCGAVKLSTERFQGELSKGLSYQMSSLSNIFRIGNREHGDADKEMMIVLLSYFFPLTNLREKASSS